MSTITSGPTDAQPSAATTSSIVRVGLLSFAWPGLGHWYVGRRQAAALFGLPVVLLAVAILARALAGVASLVASLVNPPVALTAFFLVVVIGVWRLAALLEAVLRLDPRGAIRGRSGAVIAALAALIIAMHAGGGVLTWSLYATGSRIFVVDPTPLPSVDPGESAAPTDDYLATPFATPVSADARITILLTGIDKNTERSHSLTDTLLVVSVDPSTKAVSMVSFPRDIAEFPLYNGGTYRGKINSLMTYAGQHPDRFPDGPLPTLTHELSFLLGTPIHYYAALDLDGFERMIDVVGGVTVKVERSIRDGRYDWLDGSPNGFFLSSGTHTLDGRTALAYVRSRYGVGDNDFTRAARQQQLLVALVRKLTEPAMLTRLPAILDVAGDTIRTNFPPDRIDEMVDLAQGVDPTTIRRFVLQPPIYSVHPPTASTNNTYILRLHEDALRQLSVELYGPDSDFWTGRFDPAGSPIPAESAP